jgi:hypothetical protein
VKQKKDLRNSTALHLEPRRAAQAQLRQQVLECADEIFDQFIAGKSLDAIAKDLPFKPTAWKLREVLMTEETTSETYANAKILRSHQLVEGNLELSNQAAAIGSESGLKVAIDTRFKLAAKLNPAEYGEKSKVEHTGANGGPIKLLAMTDEELLKIAAQGMKDGDQ